MEHFSAWRRRAGPILAALVASTPIPAAAESAIVNLHSIQRGAGDHPAVVLDGAHLTAAMRDSDQRYVTLHYRVGEGGTLSAGYKTIGSQSVAGSVAATIYGTTVTATLQSEGAGPGLGALTLDTFEMEDGAVSHRHRHRAVAGTQIGTGGKVVVKAASPITTGGASRAGAGRADDLSTGDKPEMFASEVAIADVSVYTPDGGQQAERVVTAIIAEDGELRLDLWQIGAAKVISHVGANDNAGAASRVSIVRWNKGVVTALIDSAGEARFVAWEITAAGAIVRRGTATAGAARDVAVAGFDDASGGGRFVVAIRQTDHKLRTLIMQVSGSGLSHTLVADGMAPPGSGRAAYSISVSRAGAANPDAPGPDSFYTATRDANGKLYLMNWRLSGDNLTATVKKQDGLEIANAAIALAPYAPRVQDDADTFVTVSQSSSGLMRVDLWSSHFVDLNAADGLAEPNGGADLTPTPSLVFSKNSPQRILFGDSYPEDMPQPRLPIGFQDCSRDEAETIRRAWTRAHYNVWRSQQVMQWLRDNTSPRAAAWDEGYVHEIGSAPSSFANYAPRGWFGRYDSGRFSKAWKAVDKVWNQRFKGWTFTVKCRVNDNNEGAHPCYSNADPAANHIGVGVINFCDNFFASNSLDNHARLVVHEVLHWMKIPDSVFWVTDTHDWWDRCGLGGYHIADQLYHDKAAFIANNQGCNQRNYERAVRNNDNYAYFTRQLGSRVYSGQLKSFPTMSFWD
jgi:hypothetical protein